MQMESKVRWLLELLDGTATTRAVPHATAIGLPLGLRRQYQPLAHQMPVEHLHGMRIMRR